MDLFGVQEQLDITCYLLHKRLAKSKGDTRFPPEAADRLLFLNLARLKSRRKQRCFLRDCSVCREMKNMRCFMREIL